MIKQTWLDNQKPQNITDFCLQHGYQATITDAEGKEIDNPETEKEFLVRTMKEVYKNAILSYRANKAQEEARNATITAMEKEII